MSTILIARALSAAAIAVSLVSPSPAQAAPTATTIDFKLMHTTPVCSGKPETVCSASDVPRSAAKSGIEAEVSRIIDRARDARTSKITVAYLSFSNQSILTKLCAKANAGFKIDVYLDDETNRPGGVISADAKALSTCSKNMVVNFLGSKVPWRLHHNKFLMVDPGGASPVSVNFSSGNASQSGLSIHFDHWVMMQAPRASDLVKTHECVISGLQAAMRAKAEPIGSGGPAKKYWVEYRKTIEACTPSGRLFTSNTKQWVEGQIAKEEVAALFSPDPQDRTLETLVDHIDRVVAGGSIHGAVQLFTHTTIARALARAKTRGVDVRLILEDNVASGEAEIPAEYTNYRDNLRGKVSVRFIRTNQSVHQLMHNKFLILDGLDGRDGRKGQTRVFSGAGQFTGKAMTDNFENFYFTQNAGLTREYQEMFAWLEGLSVDERDVPRVPFTPRP